VTFVVTCLATVPSSACTHRTSLRRRADSARSGYITHLLSLVSWSFRQIFLRFFYPHYYRFFICNVIYDCTSHLTSGLCDVQQKFESLKKGENFYLYVGKNHNDYSLFTWLRAFILCIVVRAGPFPLQGRLSSSVLRAERAEDFAMCSKEVEGPKSKKGLEMIICHWMWGGEYILSNCPVFAVLSTTDYKAWFRLLYPICNVSTALSFHLVPLSQQQIQLRPIKPMES
jgi:hypothetical protein